ncbi:MAG: DUF86 domain-containing protein [Candidatus Lokiarchaeota archaeon]|nr:DUF86 domain-containing protein [Candidatus Lokiarchaeota archaeon]
MEKIDSYIKDVDYDKFVNTSLIHDAVLRQLGIIGEASKQLSSDFKNEHSRILWKEIAGMRDKIIHQYFGVDFELVWKTLKEDLPILQEFVKEINPKMEDEDYHE